MTLLSIFSLSRFRESKVDQQPTSGGITVNHWFWGAAKRIQKAIDKNQLQAGKKPVTPKHTPRPKKPAHYSPKHKTIHPIKLAADMVRGRSLKAVRREADSASAVPLVVVPGVKKETAALKISSRKFRESQPAGDQDPNKFRVVIIEEGMGNLNDAFYYNRDALESAVDLFNGLKIYADHPSLEEEEIRPERSTRDILGHYENVALEEGPSGVAWLCADVNILPSKDCDWARARMVRAVENAEKFPDKDFVGISINAAGDADKTPIDDMIKAAPQGARDKLVQAKNEGIETVKVVKTITAAVSADMVTEAGAGGKILKIIERKNSDGKKGKGKKTS